MTARKVFVEIPDGPFRGIQHPMLAPVNDLAEARTVRVPLDATALSSDAEAQRDFAIVARSARRQHVMLEQTIFPFRAVRFAK